MTDQNPENPDREFLARLNAVEDQAMMATRCYARRVTVYYTELRAAGLDPDHVLELVQDFASSLFVQGTKEDDDE